MNATLGEPTPIHVYDAILRLDFPSFAHKCFLTLNPQKQLHWNWHLDAVSHELMQIYLGDNQRLAVNVPPRSLKSILISVAFVAWCLGHRPGLNFLCASYGQDLADDIARPCYLIMSSEWYQRVFPGTRLDRRKSSPSHFITTAGGSRLATSVGGQLTGRGADIIIIDDPMKAGDANSKAEQARVVNWFDSTLPSRLDAKSDGRMILVMQRLHVADLTSHVLDKGGWKHLCLPAIAQTDMQIQVGDDEAYEFKAGTALHPEREGLQILEELKRDMGTYNFSAQYLQEPVPPEGNLIRREWLRWFDHKPFSEEGDKIVISWDTASKVSGLADYSVGTVWLIRKLPKGEHYYLLDLVREKLELPDLRRRVISLRDRWSASTVLIEDASAGQGLIQILQQEGFPVIGIKVGDDKISRFSTQALIIEEGRVFFPTSAPWLETLMQELLQFPAGRHDDQVDSISQFLNWAQRRVEFYAW